MPVMSGCIEVDYHAARTYASQVPTFVVEPGATASESSVLPRRLLHPWHSG